jgi:hypothetical protein
MKTSYAFFPSRLIIGIAFAGLPVLSAQDTSQKEPARSSSTAEMSHPKLISTIQSLSDEKVRGIVVFKESGEGVKITGQVRGLVPDQQYRVTVREYGDLADLDEGSMGEPFNPPGTPDKKSNGSPGQNSPDNPQKASPPPSSDKGQESRRAGNTGTPGVGEGGASEPGKSGTTGESNSGGSGNGPSNQNDQNTTPPDNNTAQPAPNPTQQGAQGGAPTGPIGEGSQGGLGSQGSQGESQRQAPVPPEEEDQPADLGLLTADPEGTIRIEKTVSEFRLAAGDKGLLGRSVILMPTRNEKSPDGTVPVAAGVIGIAKAD